MRMSHFITETRIVGLFICTCFFISVWLNLSEPTQTLKIERILYTSLIVNALFFLFSIRNIYYDIKSRRNSK